MMAGISKFVLRSQVLLLLFMAGCSQATTTDVESSDSLQVREIVSGLSVPWGMAFISETEMLITEKPGTIKRLVLDSGELFPVGGAPAVVDSGQGGLLDIVAAPDFDESGWLYLTYSRPVEEGAATALARARLQGDNLVAFEDLFVSRHRTDVARHFGSRIVFDDEGHLFFSHGDRGARHHAQDLGDHAGTILRLNLDGSVPDDNPYVDQEGARPEIWSYGHRNPQGLDYDAATGRLWAIEHGPRGGDEINLVEPGRNYGWPVISYGKEYMAPVMVGEGTHRDGMEQPVKYYVPSIAPGGMIHYNGDHYPELKGSLLAGALALTHLNQVVLDDNGKAVREVRHLEALKERIRHVVEGPGGKIYLSTDSGKILELTAK